MHPLTVTWAPHIYTEWGWKNFQSWIHSGLDNFLFTPNGRAHRLLTRLALENAASIAGMFLTTECVIADAEDEDAGMPSGGGMPGGMGGMGGMM